MKKCLQNKLGGSWWSPSPSSSKVLHIPLHQKSGKEKLEDFKKTVWLCKMSPVSHRKWADSWRRCSWLFEWTLHHWDMIKNSSAWVQLYLSSSRCLRMIKHGTAFNTKRGYIPPWKSGVALCPGALPQPFDSCQGFITQKAAHSAAQYGTVPLCVV